MDYREFYPSLSHSGSTACWRKISVGGMAEVYKAKAFGVEGFERLLAVKKILNSIAEDETFISMFHR